MYGQEDEGQVSSETPHGEHREAGAADAPCAGEGAEAPGRPAVRAASIDARAEPHERRDHDRKGGASAGGLEGFFDGNGLDLMRRLQSNRPIRGIAISGFGTEQDLRRSREAGYERHLTKPVDFNVLGVIEGVTN